MSKKINLLSIAINLCEYTICELHCKIVVRSNIRSMEYNVFIQTIVSHGHYKHSEKILLVCFVPNLGDHKNIIYLRNLGLFVIVHN